MKTRITSQSFRNLALLTVFAFFSLNLTGQTTHDVTVSDFLFTPSTLTITAGDQVTWTNTDGSHNVNGNKTIFPSNPESFGNSVGEVWTYSFTFNTPGTYNYQCDPHAVMGMTGQIIVNPKQDPGPYMLTVNFTGMNPHVGQTLWLAVIDKATQTEIARVEQLASENFSIEVMGLEKGKSYQVDFFADHNRNGVYDAPPTDHAWRSEVDNVSSNVAIDFAHNTTFTDIAWKNKLTVNFTGMNPHLNQKLTLYVKQADTNVNVDTLMVDPVAQPDFNLSSYKIKPGLSYHIDFFADHNKNGMYDAPPADHAWRIDLNNVLGDTLVNFAHNTKFTDILGPVSHKITVSAGKFTPAIQTITAGDTVIWTNIEGSHNVNGTLAKFPSNPESFGNDVGEGWTYKFVFTKPGTYDYQCDPHAIYGMVGKIIVNPNTSTGPYTLTVNFTGMNPHVGQTLWLAVIDKATQTEIARVEQLASENFSIEVMGLEKGKSYQVDFFADHNRNGVYDAPPTDHAWKSEVDNVSSNVAIDFAHNTTFTDIAWKNKLTVNFTGMNPHLNQKLTLYVKQADTNVNVDTLMVDPVAQPDFNVSSYKIKPGLSYHIDFFADHNKNGMYDAPPADHAWRIDLNNVLGDTLVNFAHNTKFTDIFGPASHKITVSAGKFTPAIQTITVGDTVIWTNIEGSHNVNGTQAKFPSNPESFGNDVGEGWTYKFVFTKPGTYDYQCDPHAIYGMVGKIIVNPNTSTGPYTLTVNFTGMNPHVGQTLWLAVIDKATQTEVARVEQLASENFSIEVMGLEKGKSYQVDFFADHNKNGVYDAPPTDHAWRREVDNVSGNVVIDFAHNTTFTDIAWKYKLTVHFTGMTPHVGQTLTLFLVWADTGFYHDTVVISPVPAATFDINSYNIKPGFSYSIDFYADHNGNGVYNSPPVDHAWRLPLTNVLGDTIVHFAHNTNFTDILPATAVRADAEISGKIRLYPNPASQYIQLLVPSGYDAIRSVKVYSITGSAVDEKAFSGNAESLLFDVSKYKKGIYFMDVTAGNRREVLKFIKQ